MIRLSRIAFLGLASAAAPPALAQAPTPAPAPNAQSETRALSIDGIAAIVGDEIITFGELNSLTVREARSQGATTQEDLEYLRELILRERFGMLLKTQAGQDMGFDPELVRRSEKRLFESEVEQRGGPVSAARQFEQSGTRPEELREYLGKRLFARSWEWAVTGRAPGPTGRTSVDRFVRPGQIYATYQLLARSEIPEERAKIGAESERVVLQQLVLPLDQNGGEQATLELAARILTEIEKGADFTEVVRLWGVVPDDGIMEAIALPDVARLSSVRHRTPALFDYAESAEVDALSSAMLGWTQKGSQPAIWIYRISERIPETPPGDYLDVEVQRKLKDELERSVDQLRLRVALERLAEAAYIWPPALRQP